MLPRAHPLCSSPVSSVAFSPTDKDFLAVGYRGAGVAVFCTAHLLPVATMDECVDVVGVAWTTSLLVLDAQGIVWQWTPATQEREFAAGIHNPQPKPVIKEGAVALGSSGAVAMDDGHVVMVVHKM